MADSNTQYWCHSCERIVDTIRDPEIKCTLCDSGFVEEMNPGIEIEPSVNLRSDRTLSLWAPILLGMTGSANATRTNTGTRFRHFTTPNRELEEGDDELDREFEDFIRRRRRRSVRQLLQVLREESERRSNQENGERNRELERERTALLVSAFNQAVALQGSSSSNPLSNFNLDTSSNSLEDYFIGPGFDLLLQHLTENDPSRQGTPPAKREAVEALPSVKIEEFSLTCSVCLDEFEIGSEAKMMPCKHKFHGKCIVQWLELHCSCPVCRFKLPANETKDSNGGSSASGAREESGDGDDDSDGDESGTTANGSSNSNGGNNDGNNRPWVLTHWPFNSLFSMSGSHDGSHSSSRSGGNVNSDEN
ncbi:hypothetical protein LUZ63_018093 [Rhynchospora breviuscula]|uniref:RING-type E3 ubiquitin transferase n=1 Tax=Rhynchospora breviuscula TaxID=2022672 RepID=A0A9Q0C3Q4_9POAL|nr:hypothetical protein LUZ63_018093 [Rhynchospora breviuscula]